PARELSRHELGREVFLEAELRIGVQFAANGREVGMPGPDGGNRRVPAEPGARRIGIDLLVARVHRCGWKERAGCSECTGAMPGPDQWAPAARSMRSRGSTAKYNRSTIRLMTTNTSAIRHR